MESNGNCNSCNRRGSLRRLELYLHDSRGAVQALSVRVCRPCTTALLESLQLTAVMEPLLPSERVKMPSSRS